MLLYCVLSIAYSIGGAFAEERPALTSQELVTKSWEAHGKRDVEATFTYTRECIDRYQQEAEKIQASLQEMPKSKNDIEAAGALNDVATAYFIQAESYMRQDKPLEAKKLFQLITEKFPFAQAWDQRGWYWSIADASKQSIKKIETGSIELDQKKKVSQLPTKVVLYDSGTEDFVDYARYGTFENIGTKEYRYIIKDQEGLMAAVGEGIYPNTTSIRWDPEFKKAAKEKRLEGSHWDFVTSPDLEAAFLKWATAPEPEGVKLFYVGLMLEKSGLITHALKCYYAIVVNFPGSYGWTYWKTPWHVGQAALSKIQYLLKQNPQLGYRLVDADIKILNGFDNDISNDVVITSPGTFVKSNPLEQIKTKPTPESRAITKQVGKGKVHLVQHANGGWELIADNKPYVIKGITYTPTKVGQSPDEGTMGNWMYEDFNNNGRIDGPYDSFVDANSNNLQDKDEPTVGDFRLLKEMGVNTIRLYHHPHKVNKELLRDLYNKYGIRVILGDFLGKYALGSGAPWYPGTDYTNEEHKKNMMQSVVNMVLEFKDEPFILFWLLGNENVYGFACNADKEPDAFFKFANEVAAYIKTIDPDHPVAICSGDVLFLDKFGNDAPDIDIFGTNAYRGDYGFGYIWKQVKEQADKPVFITEFGCPAYIEGKNAEEAEESQAKYHEAAWQDIQGNMAFEEGQGNAIGGVIFEWLDEWWKAYEPSLHDTKGLATGPFPGGYMYEEWFGLSGQGDGKMSPYLRQLRKSYYLYKKLFNN